MTYHVYLMSSERALLRFMEVSYQIKFDWYFAKISL